MFIKRNCVWLIAATLSASNALPALAGGGFMQEVQQGQKYAGEAQQVEGTAKELHKDAENLFHKKPADAAATGASDAKAIETKTTELKTSDTTTAGDTTVKSTESTSATTTTSK